MTVNIYVGGHLAGNVSLHYLVKYEMAENHLALQA